MSNARTLAPLCMALVIGTLGLTACGDAQSTAPEWDGTYAAVGVCGTVAQPIIRVDDDACPAGDAIVPNWPYQWYYLPMDRGAPDIDVVYVGAPLDMDTHHHYHYVRERPAKVTSSLQVVRGAPRDARSAPVTSGSPPGTAPTAAKVAQRQPARNIERGGFGVPQNRAAEAPRASTPGAKSATAAPRVAPPAPQAVRVSSPTVKTGR